MARNDLRDRITTTIEELILAEGLQSTTQRIYFHAKLIVFIRQSEQSFNRQKNVQGAIATAKKSAIGSRYARYTFAMSASYALCTNVFLGQEDDHGIYRTCVTTRSNVHEEEAICPAR